MVIQILRCKLCITQVYQASSKHVNQIVSVNHASLLCQVNAKPEVGKQFCMGLCVQNPDISGNFKNKLWNGFSMPYKPIRNILKKKVSSKMRLTTKKPNKM